MTRLRALAATLMLLTSACSSGSRGDQFFDPNSLITASGWDMQLAKISPDGNHVAVIGVDPSGSWVVGLADHGSVKSVGLDLTGKLAQDLAWMPDGHRLLIADNKLGGSSTTQIDCVDINGGTCASIQVAGAWHHSNRAGMDVSPDGTTLAVQGHPGSLDNDDGKVSMIYLINIAQPALTVLAADPKVSKEAPVWLDAGHVACVAGDPANVGSPPGNGRLTSYATNSNVSGTALSNTGFVVDSAGAAPPGGVIFHATTTTANSGGTGMYLYTPGASSSKFVGSVAGDHPSMAPGGVYFVYTTPSSPTQDATISRFIP